MQDFRRIVADWLRDAMAVLKLSAPQLAVRAGVAKSTVYRLLAGSVHPEDSTIEALAKALNTSVPRMMARFDGAIKSDAAVPGRPVAGRSAGAGVGGRLVAEGNADAQYARRADNTPGAVASGGEEAAPGSSALDAIRDEAEMAATVLQRAIRRALERDEYVQTREGRDLVIDELVEFSQRLGLIGLGDIGLEISNLAHRMRRPEVSK